MATKLLYKSDAFEAIHSAARGLYETGAIDQKTLRDFDASCLANAPSEGSAKKTRTRAATRRKQSTADGGPNTS